MIILPDNFKTLRTGATGGGAACFAKEVVRAAAIFEGSAPSAPGADFRSVVMDVTTRFPSGFHAEVLVAAREFADVARTPDADAMAAAFDHVAADVATRPALSPRQRLEALAGALVHAVTDETRPEAREAALSAFAFAMAHVFDAMRDLLADDEAVSAPSRGRGR